MPDLVFTILRCNDETVPRHICSLYATLVALSVVRYVSLVSFLVWPVSWARAFGEMADISIQ